MIPLIGRPLIDARLIESEAVSELAEMTDDRFKVAE
jgi:hypothetical protein